ncbi:hypothetical protein PAXINDRAFT_170082 [Paxillus involutus ATCC 200175]|uniref:Uncharacterized protein n=1 Tax=Paxillus involutus ATCC 200175 TaxID=664439 RepID=A0A0C9TDV0_PAXIN|nr:hypothetical protein PAXINDRAFT_170082 [Paxillus involutus ATCC 200175]
MAAEPIVEPTTILGKGLEDEGEESDEYEVVDEEEVEGNPYEPGQYEDEDEEGEEGELELQDKHASMTALLLGSLNQNGAGANEEEDEEDEDEDEDYHEGLGEGTAERPFDLSSVAGSKRGVDELSEGDAEGDDDLDAEEEEDGESAAKKVKV